MTSRFANVLSSNVVSGPLANLTLPPPDVYELEYIYWPWGLIIAFLRDWLTQHVPPNGCVADYMCGTGYLLNQLRSERNDVATYGCSLTPSYVDYACSRYPDTRVVMEDVFDFVPPSRPDVIVCAAGLHHLAYTNQAALVSKIADDLAAGSYFLLAEEVLRDTDDARDRRLAALELGSAIIRHAIERSAPAAVLSAAIELLHRDVFEEGEYKRSRHELEVLLQPHFAIEKSAHLWPSDSHEYGDIVFVCRRLDQ